MCRTISDTIFGTPPRINVLDPPLPQSPRSAIGGRSINQSIKIYFETSKIIVKHIGDRCKWSRAYHEAPLATTKICSSRFNICSAFHTFQSSTHSLLSKRAIIASFESAAVVQTFANPLLSDRHSALANVSLRAADWRM